jgi:hypothetical protein
VLRANESESPLEQESAGPAIIHAVDTPAASEERSKFQRTVGRWDTTFLMLAAIIVLDTLGAVSSYGAQSFTWLIVMVVFFLVPYGLITAELGTAFAEEGGPYVWVKLAFGRAAAAVVATMYWVDNPIWLAGTLAITAMAAFSTFFVDLSLSWQYVFGLLFIWAGIASVITALKFGKWVATIGAAIRILLIAFFTLTVLIYAGEHGLHGFGAGAFKPTWLVFLAAAPILIFNLEGFELPSAASEEMINPKRDVPFAVLRSGIGTLLFYGIPVLAILLVLPAVPAVQRRGIPRRAAAGVRRLRGPPDRLGCGAHRRRQGSRRYRGDRGDHRTALLGRDLADRIRPRASGRGVRRRGSQGVRLLLQAPRNADRGEPRLGRGLDPRPRPHPDTDQRKYGEILQRHAGGGHLHGDDGVPPDLPVGDQAQVQPPRRSASVPDSVGEVRAVGGRDLDHGLVRAHHDRDHLPGHRHGAS